VLDLSFLRTPPQEWDQLHLWSCVAIVYFGLVLFGHVLVGIAVLVVARIFERVCFGC
jgi:hypothetical protein